jgi:hypothetical protein
MREEAERALDRLVQAAEVYEVRLAAARQLSIVASALWTSALVGHPAPVVEHLRERMRAIRPGDLVMEVSRVGRNFDPDSIGTLLRVELVDPGAPSDWRYVVEPLCAPGTEQGWTNAEFVAIPTDHLFKWAYEEAQPSYPCDG